MDRFLIFLHRLTGYLARDLGGGPRPLKLAHVVNLQKGGTLLVYLGLIAFYGTGSPAIWTLVALHGGYGLCWLIKEAAFPDRAWQDRITLPSALVAFLAVLGPYWVIGWVLISGLSQGLQSPAAIASAVLIHTVGLALMLGADAQKFYTLKHRPGLIETGFFARIRHPNYLGEMMIYGSYALLVWHWLPVVILAFIWGVLFAPNIAAKERSLARHPGWAAYKARTGLLLPRRNQRGPGGAA